MPRKAILIKLHSPKEAPGQGRLQGGMYYERVAKLTHTKWECKYHVVFVPKYRRKVFYGKLRNRIGGILRELCIYKGLELLGGHAMPGHIHMCLSIPPKYSVSFAIGYLKGKSAIRVHKDLLNRRRGFTNLNFWTRGYFVSTVGYDEGSVRAYIRNQDKLGQGGQGELNFGDDSKI